MAARRRQQWKKPRNVFSEIEMRALARIAYRRWPHGASPPMFRRNPLAVAATTLHVLTLAVDRSLRRRERFTTDSTITICASSNPTTAPIPPVHVVDETSWIWHTEKKDLTPKSQQELIEFCRQHILISLPYHPPSHLVATAVQNLQEVPSDKDRNALRAKLIQHILLERNIHRKLFPQYLKDFKALKQLIKPKEKEFYKAHSHPETIALCKTYGVVGRGKSHAQKVRDLVRKKRTVTAQEEDILQQHGQYLNKYLNLVGLERKQKGQIASSRLHVLRRLNRLRNINLAVSRKLASDPALQPLGKDVVMDSSSLDWKEELLFYRRKRQKLYKILGMEWNKGGKYASQMRKICRRLKIKLPKF